ncbi:glutamate ABC transporter permease [Sinorhizobium sp. GW3]|nr:glutamate ABC transporter permease [Sinorhizobium sp. GW3]
MNYNWNWGILIQQSLDGSGSYIEMLLLGLQTTVVTASCSWIIALAMGLVIGVMRTLPSRLARAFAGAYVELFRNVPLIVQLFLWYFVLPELLPQSVGAWLKGLPSSAFWTTILSLGLYMSARVAEQIRAGIASLPGGQKLAGAAIGLTTFQTYRYVLLPMAFRIILPPLTSEFLNTIKNTSVALTIGLVELTARARAMQEFTFQVFEAFTIATLLYLAVNTIVTVIMRCLEHRMGVARYTAGR